MPGKTIPYMAGLMSLLLACGPAAAVTMPDKTPVPAKSKAVAVADTPSGATSSDRAAAADPANLVDPDRAAAAIIVRAMSTFNSIRIVPIAKSGNSATLIRDVLTDESGLDDLHEAIRANGAMMKTLKAHDVAVDDVVAVTTDRNDNAILFTRN